MSFLTFVNNMTSRHFSIDKTRQQNRMAERMNRTIQQMERGMLDEFETTRTFWGRRKYNSKYP